MKGGNAAERRSFTMTKRLSWFWRDSAHFRNSHRSGYGRSRAVYDIIYLAAVIVIFIIMAVVIRKKCKK